MFTFPFIKKNKIKKSLTLSIYLSSLFIWGIEQLDHTASKSMKKLRNISVVHICTIKALGQWKIRVIDGGESKVVGCWSCKENIVSRVY